MLGEQLPSGRERAIETLIDSEPNGASYRANRIRVSYFKNAVGFILLLHKPLTSLMPSG